MSDARDDTYSLEGLCVEDAGQRDDVVAAEDGRARRPDARVAHWHVYQRDAYEVEVRLRADEDGGFSAYVPCLPGVVSEGETVEEVEASIREALLAVLESYRRDKEPIPWNRASMPIEPGEIARWIVVHA